MRFLGTGAADVIPNPFCRCKLCEDARLHPEHTRLRSMFLLDDQTLIDFGPDLAATAVRHNIDLTNVERTIITHTHQDHFCASNAGLVHMTSTPKDHQFEIYVSDAAYTSLQARYTPLQDVDLGLDEVNALKRNEICYHTVTPGVTSTIGNYKVTPVQTSHHVTQFEDCVNYLIENTDGKKLLYATDTGIYPEASVEQLRGAHIDILIMDSTFGSNDKDVRLKSHLCGPTFVQQLHTFLDNNIIHEETKVYATHVNHKHDLTHEDYQAWFDNNSPIKVIVAWDGLEINW